MRRPDIRQVRNSMSILKGCGFISYYYNYYIGYEKDGVIYPLGPYDCFGQLCEALSKSRSFASNLYNLFSPINNEKISDELRKRFGHKNYSGEDVFDAKYAYLNELPSGDFIKRGYFLIRDVQRYEEDSYDFDGFYDYVGPTVYAAMLQHEMQFGHPEPKIDCEGEEYEVHGASDYMFYAYPDYNSKEYEMSLIRNVANMLGEFNANLSNIRLVVIENEE